MIAAALVLAQLVFEPEEKPGTATDSVTAPATESRAYFISRLRAAADLAHDAGGERVLELFAHAAAGLELRAPEWKAVVEARARWLANAVGFDLAGSKGEMELDAGDAYVDLCFDAFDLRLGAQTFTWGATPGLAPADALNPGDARDPATLAAAGKLPVIAASARARWGDLRAEAAFIPFFRPPRVTLFGQDWAPLRPGGIEALPDLSPLLDRTAHARYQEALLATIWPAQTLADPQGGARLTYALGDLDLSLSYLEVFDALPDARMDPDLGTVLRLYREGRTSGPEFFFAAAELSRKLDAGEKIVESRFLRARTVAADASFAWEDWTFTLDAGFSPRRTLYTNDFRAVSRPLLSTAASVQYTHGEDVRVVLGGAIYAAPGMAAGERVLFLEPPGAEAGAHTALWGYAFAAAQFTLDRGRWDLSAGALAGHRGDFVLLPRAAFKPAAGHEFALGAEWVEGAADTAFGYFTHNDLVYLEYVARL